MRAMLSPLEHEHPDGWRGTVNETLRELFGADAVTFQLPAPEVDLLYSNEIDVALLRQYLPTLADHDRKFSHRALKKTAELEVCNRAMLWGDELDEYYGSPYYHELIVPARCFDMLCAATRLPGEEHPAELYLHHESRHGPRFGTRGLQLLRMLYPAFRAGTRTFQRFHAHRKHLFNALDAIDDWVFVFDMDARLLHRNVAYQNLALGDSEAEAVSANANELAGSLVALCVARRARGGRDPARVTRKVWIGARAFTLHGSVLERVESPRQPSLLVTVREEGKTRPRRVGGSLAANGSPGAHGPLLSESEDGPVVPADLAGRFDLTPRQAEVAGLLARRLTNREVAERLRISVHTARHHTEHVLAKLGIHSRSKVALTLFGPPSDRPDPASAASECERDDDIPGG